jgi:predicted HAD superfamily Cof-like phosphohydrolase
MMTTASVLLLSGALPGVMKINLPGGPIVRRHRIVQEAAGQQENSEMTKMASQRAWYDKIYMDVLAIFSSGIKFTVVFNKVFSLNKSKIDVENRQIKSFEMVK